MFILLCLLYVSETVCAWLSLVFCLFFVIILLFSILVLLFIWALIIRWSLPGVKKCHSLGYVFLFAYYIIGLITCE